MSVRELKGILEGRNHKQPTQEGDDGIGTKPIESNRNSFFVDREERQPIAMVDMSETRKHVECPICLGIIRKTAVTECGHRFCKECIEKTLRLGHHNCPTCRVHCPSRRSLRAHENFDRLISNMYPDNNQYEEEELELNETEWIRNEHIKATISQTRKRQSKPKSSKRSTTVETPIGDETIIRGIPLSSNNEGNGASSSHHVQVRGLTSYQPRDSNKGKDKDHFSGDDHCVGVIPTRANNPIRRRKRVRMVRLSELPDTRINFQANPLRTMEDIQIGNSSEEEKTDSSSGDEWCPLRRKKRCPLRRKKRAKRVSSSQPSERERAGVSDENSSKQSKEESLGTNGTPLVLPESLKWGRSSLRSRMRKINVRRNRIERLVAYLRNTKRTQEEQKIPNLKKTSTKLQTELNNEVVACVSFWDIERLQMSKTEENKLSDGGGDIKQFTKKKPLRL